MEIEADFQRFYQINLGDLFTGRLSVRRFGVLLYGLPPGCATWRGQGGDLAWSDETAALFAVRHAVQSIQAGFATNPKPVPFPEPPEWGYQEKAAEEESVAARRMKRHLERVGRSKGDEG